MPIKGLAVFSAPRGKERLNIRLEKETLVKAINNTGYAHLFDITPELHITLPKFKELLKDDFQLIQFSGHSNQTHIFFEKEDGTSRRIPINSFIKFIEKKLQSPDNQLKCMIFNSCFSFKLGEELSKLGICTISMEQEIKEEAARLFTEGFYEAYSPETTILEMFENAKNNMQLHNHPNWKIPELKGDGNLKFDIIEIPEFQPYQGVLLIQEHYEILKEFEGLIGNKSIPIVNKVEIDTFGFSENDGRIISLGLPSCGLTFLPFSIKNLNSLQILGLNNNEITTLPKTIGHLNSLQILWIKNNKIKILPDTIGNLKSLTELNLSANQLLNLPESIGNLQSLIKLELYHNQIKKIPKTIGSLNSLQTLNLSKNQLNEIPDEIGQLKLLTYLDLSDNLIKSLPSTIGQLNSLKNLILNSNRLVSLPISIDGLTSLIYLSLWKNKLKKLPNSIGNLKSLEYLILSDNQLKSFPISIICCKNLEIFSFKNNPIKIVPHEISSWLKKFRKKK